MNFIKDQANVCKTCTCGDRLKAERVLASTQLLSNSLIYKSPCIMICVCSTVGDIMSTMGDILSTVGCSVPWGIS